MKPIVKYLLFAIMLIATPLFAAAAEQSEDQAESSLNPKETIFEHLGDAYGWEVPFNHHVRIALPVIVKGTDGLHVFSSARVANGATYTDGDATFVVAGKDSPNKGKVIELVDGKEVKPSFDISITKNVAALFIAIALVVGLMLWLARFHKNHPYKSPRKGLGFMELIVVFIYDSVIKSTLQDKAKKFAPYLMTVFFFIFIMNLLGLVVVFPGGANLTGNIAVTMVLALLTFLITNIFGTKHYWKDIFWPDVPLWLKFPIPIMPLIEVFGIFTKPAALTVRLFANMMGGHMIVIVLTLLIFIFAAVNPIAGAATTVISVAFSVFMLLIDVLVSFIQAYVFTMLSTIFISLAQEQPHEEHDQAADAKPAITQ
jgi:F-type H+-transporting ATPase subunit a